jgi:hypothetical protein
MIQELIHRFWPQQELCQTIQRATDCDTMIPEGLRSPANPTTIQMTVGLIAPSLPQGN